MGLEKNIIEGAKIVWASTTTTATVMLCMTSGMGNFYSARNARIASAVLATAIPSVCLSVTRRYCVKTTARSTVQSATLDSKMCLVL